MYEVMALVQAARAYQAEEKINMEIAVLQEAFKRVQATKKVCGSCRMYTLYQECTGASPPSPLSPPDRQDRVR